MTWKKIKNILMSIFILLLICGGIVSMIYFVIVTSLLTLCTLILKVIICFVLLVVLINFICLIFNDVED